MKRLSLEPDESMRWIYNHRHPNYNTDYAKDLRERRARAIQSAPEWMKQEAQLNDVMRTDAAHGEEEK